jgi:hypothetical protein
MKKLLSLILIILFYSCSKKNENHLPRVIVSEQENVVEVNCENMIEFFNYSFLVANSTESINLKDDDVEFSKKYNECFQRINLDTILPKYDISVFVDTTYFFPRKGFKYKYVEFPKKVIVDGLIDGKVPTSEESNLTQKEYAKYLNEDNGSNNYVNSYPLVIYNKSNKGVLTRFKYIQEAKDVNGNWKPIEYYYNFSGCGNPESFYFKLLSKNFMIYPIIKYGGNFKTKLRVKLYNKGNIYYSNEFEGFINQSQFDTIKFRNKFELSNPSYDFDEVSTNFFLSE